MRSYAQYCPIARTLDLIGDRWVLLIVRELLLRPARFTDLKRHLPGVAANLLAERLRALEHAGIVERAGLPPPAASTVYRLTPRGLELRPVLLELARWGAPTLVAGPGDDAVDVRWLELLGTAAFAGVSTTGLPPLAVTLLAGGDPIIIEVAPDGVSVSTGTAAQPGLVITTHPATVIALLTGRLTPAAACDQGLARLDGVTNITLDHLDALLQRSRMRPGTPDADVSSATHRSDQLPV